MDGHAAPPAPAAVLAGSDADRSFGGALRRLRHAQKPPARGTPAYSRFVNRRMGRVLAAAAYRLSMTPNQVTLVSALFTFTGIAVLAAVRPRPWTALLVAAALVLGYALDSADGQLARLRGGGTPGGEWLDHVVDAFKSSALHLAVLVAWFRFYDLSTPALLLVPAAFTLVAAGFFFATWITDAMRRSHPEFAPAPADASRAAVVRSIVVVPTDYGVLILAFVVFAWKPVFMTVYALLFAGTALFLMAALPKWYREVSTFSNPRA